MTYKSKLHDLEYLSQRLDRLVNKTESHIVENEWMEALELNQKAIVIANRLQQELKMRHDQIVENMTKALNQNMDKWIKTTDTRL